MSSFLPQRFVSRLLLLVTLAALPLAVRAQEQNLLFGNPSGAKADPANRDNFLMVKPYFTLSYNNSKGTPNWVSWEVTAADQGSAVRSNHFHPDDELPAGFAVVTPADYASTGFDKGHMCDCADRSAGAIMDLATFVMTNMIPQAPNVNEHRWEQLEAYCRQLAKAGNHVYIICGPSGQGGEGKHGGVTQTIGKKEKVVVPASNWKVIAVLNGGPGSELAKVNAHTRLIAVIMPNTDEPGSDWAKFRVPVKQVEALTGYTFFSTVSPAVIDPLKALADTVPIHGSAN